MSAIPLTISEKILARAAGAPSFKPGQCLRVRADSSIVFDLGCSLVGPPSIQQLDAKTEEGAGSRCCGV